MTPVAGRSQDADGDDDVAPEDLFTVRPESFVAARRGLVKRLKAAGEREQAAQVASWRRPSVVDWALNIVASEHPDVVEGFLRAAAAGREAQSAAVAGRPGDDLRTAVGELRDATARLVKRADAVASRSGKAPGALAATIASRLAEIAATPVLADQLGEHRLGSGDVEADDVFADSPSGPSIAPKARAERPVKARRAPPAAPARHRADQAARRELARALAAAKRAESSAEVAADRAAAGARRAEADVAQARDRLARAEEALSSAQEQHANLSERAEEATRAVEEARTRLAREQG